MFRHSYINDSNKYERLQYRKSQSFNAYATLYALATSESESETLKKQPISVSPEIDYLLEQRENHESNNAGSPQQNPNSNSNNTNPGEEPKVDRSHWLQRVLDTNPDIKELRECINPIARASSFARLYFPTNRLIPHQVLLELISQHLKTLGLTQSQASLHSEWCNEFDIPPHKHYSQLALLVQRGIYHAERFWELPFSNHGLKKEEEIQMALDEEIAKTIGAASSIATEMKKPKPNENVYHDIKNILDEEPGDHRYFIKDENGNLSEASLNQLIYYITSAEEDMNISEIKSALCLTVSSYASSIDFFTKLRDRLRSIMDRLKKLKPPQNSKESNKESDEYTKENISGLRCINVIKEWIKISKHDIEPQVLDSIKLFVDKEVSKFYPHQAQTIFEGRSRTVSGIQTKKSEEKPPPINLGTIVGLWTGNFSLFDIPPLELARQLTVWSSNRYYAIQKSELLYCPWAVPRLKYRCPNIIALTNHYNKLTSWAVYNILSESTFEKRVEKIEYFINLGNILFQLNNYFDGSSIILAFIQPELFDLNKHKERLKPSSLSTLDELSKACEPGDNYKYLRKIQSEALNSRKPVMPAVNVLQQEIFVTFSIESYMPDGLINVQKCKRTYKSINDFEVYMRAKYCFLSIDQVQSKINQIQMYDKNLLQSLFENLPEK